MSNRVAIVTVYKNANYGSKLQSFALQRTVASLGYYPENLAVFPGNNKKRSRIRRMLRNPLSSIDFMRKYIHRNKIRARSSLFDSYLAQFINESNCSTREVENLIRNGSDPYYKYICGSDQIWAPNQFCSDFFLGFVSNKDSKIAYAPSIGLPRIPSELQDSYRQLISNIKFVSIREEDGARLVYELTKKEIEVVLDPTLLLSGIEWRMHSLEPDLDHPYILCYFLGYDREYRKWVEELGRRTGFQLVVLPFNTKDYTWGDHRIFKAGPREFLGLIDKANYVCTDSYHGVLLSLNLEKEFFPFLRFRHNDPLNQNSRVLNFLSRIDLAERIVDPHKSVDYGQIDWERVRRTIRDERRKSIAFLQRALNTQ